MRYLSFSRTRILCAVWLLACAAFAQAADVPATPDDYLEKLQTLQPGERLLLAPGEYLGGLPLHGLHGKPKAPIVIESADAERPAVLLGVEGRNTVSLRDASHLVVRNLKLDGRNLPVDAVKAEQGRAVVHHIVLEGLTIVGHGESQGIVGISTKAPAAFWTIRDNLIIGAGTGMYLGNSDGTAPFVAGVIENNVILDTLGYNLQIKQQNVRPVREGLPDGHHVTVIRGNVFSKANDASEGSWARPNLLLGHLPPAGPGSEDRYVIEGNVFYANPHEPLFHAEGNVEFKRNLLINPLGAAVAIQRYRGAPRRIQMTENFIVARNEPLTLRDLQDGFIPAIAANRMLSPDDDIARELGQWAEVSGALALQQVTAVCARPEVARMLSATAAEHSLCKTLPRPSRVQRQVRR